MQAYRHLLFLVIVLRYKYLYLTHFHYGRIKWNKRNHLVKSFTSSHTAVKKALFYLEKEGLTDLSDSYFQDIANKMAILC